MAVADHLQVADLRSSGRLWMFGFSDGVPEAALETIAPPAADWTWEHFALSDNRSRLHIERLPQLPDAVRACLLGAESRVQVNVSGDWSFGVLPDFEHQLEGDATAACRLNFAFDGHALITTRRHALQVVDRVRRDLEHNDAAPRAPADNLAHVFVISVLAHHVARFIDATEERLNGLSAQLDHAEDQVLSEHGNVDALRLGPIRRELSTRHREFVSLRSAFNRALSHRNAARAGALAERFPPLIQEIEDFDRDLAGLQDRAKLVHDELEAKRAEGANRSLRALTILSTLLLPPTVIVGAFGMNLRGIPFDQGANGFWAASLVCVVAVAVSYWALKQARIL